jgi:hypothetical protein
MMEAVTTPKTSVSFYMVTQSNIPEDRYLHAFLPVLTQQLDSSSSRNEFPSLLRNSSVPHWIRYQSEESGEHALCFFKNYFNNIFLTRGSFPNKYAYKIILHGKSERRTPLRGRRCGRKVSQELKFE